MTAAALPTRRELRAAERADVRTRRCRRRVASVVAAAALAGLGGSMVPAAAAPAGPSSPAAAPSTVDPLNPYVGQVSCDPATKPGTQALATLLLAHYKVGRSGGIGRACGTGGRSEHKEGRAWDWMLNAGNPTEKATADAFLSWLTAPGPDGKPGYQARRLGVMYVIWNHRTWATYRPEWRAYSGASPHTDHIHISLGWNGAMKRTSWWTGKAAAVDYGPCVAVQGQLAPAYSAPNHAPCPAPAPAPTTSTPSAPVPPTPTSTTTVRHTVKVGDTLYRLSVTYRTTVAAIKAANNLSGDSIRVGQVLTIPAGASRFADVPASHPFHADIEWLAAEGITAGVGNGSVFAPTSGVERQQMAGFLHRLSGDTRYDAPSRSPFSDVPTSRSLYPSVAWLVDRGITRGVGDGSQFAPLMQVERQQMAAFLFRMSGETGYEAPRKARFADVPRSHPFYREISWLADKGITTGVGDGTRFGPRSPVQRQHMAAFLHRFGG